MYLTRLYQNSRYNRSCLQWGSCVFQSFSKGKHLERVEFLSPMQTSSCKMNPRWQTHVLPPESQPTSSRWYISMGQTESARHGESADPICITSRQVKHSRSKPNSKQPFTINNKTRKGSDQQFAANHPARNGRLRGTSPDAFYDLAALKLCLVATRCSWLASKLR